MLVYDSRSETRSGPAAWRELRARIAALAGAGRQPHDDLISALIGFGVFESGVADALCPAQDEAHPTLVGLRRVAESLGEATVASYAGDEEAIARRLRGAVEACVALDRTTWGDLQVGVPEGYAYYSLYPEAYADAVVHWADHYHPPRVLTIGLRSIGTSLSAIVTGALRSRGVPCASWTLRPRGHAFDRHVSMTPRLVATLEPTASTVLIVDEGPGLSGSSLTGTATALSSLGVPDERIVFVPSWNPSPDRFVSHSAAARWPRHRAIVPSFDRIRDSLSDAGIVPAGARDISAGVWREWLHLPQPWPATQPQHERRKYVADSRLARFAGLGEYGCEVAARAAVLHDAGWSARPLGLNRGFLATEAVDGVPLSAATVTDDFIRHAAAYVAWLRRHASTSRVADVTPLVQMLLTNTREALGVEWLGAAEVLSRDASGFQEPATAVDGRMQPHEWLMTSGGGWLKTDALDHHRDHFLPGCTDAAWDVAGLLIEFELASRNVVGEYARRAGDHAISHRLPFFLAAYAAFRAGYCALATQALGDSDDGRRFEELGVRYREALRTTLESVRPAAPSGR